MISTKTTLWIISELFPPDETSTAYLLGEIANALSRKYNVQVICGAQQYDKNKVVNTNTQPLSDNLKIQRVNGTGLNKNSKLGRAINLLYMSRRIYQLAKKQIRKEDKVLIVTNPAPLVVLMGKLKNSIGFDLNILVHDVFPENTVSAGMKLPFLSKIQTIFDKAYSSASQLIVLGRDMKEVLERKISIYNTNTRITIIENWADVDCVHPRPFPDGIIKLQYAGNIGRLQALDKIIDELPDNIEFHIHGAGAMENSLKALNHPRVYFHGSYLRSQQSEVLSSCDIALVSLNENMYGLGVPSKTYNIMAAGRPILYLGPKDSEIDRLVKEEGIGLCSWPDSWDRFELISMGKIARAVAENKYRKDIILNKFLEAI